MVPARAEREGAGDLGLCVSLFVCAKLACIAGRRKKLAPRKGGECFKERRSFIPFPFLPVFCFFPCGVLRYCHDHTRGAGEMECRTHTTNDYILVTHVPA